MYMYCTSSTNISDILRHSNIKTIHLNLQVKNEKTRTMIRALRLLSSKARDYQNEINAALKFSSTIISLGTTEILDLLSMQ